MRVIEFGGRTCDRIQRFLHSYVNNELSVETTHEVLKHLESCPVCSAELQQLTRLRSEVKRAVRSRPADDAIRARIRRGLAEGVSPAAARRGNWALLVASLALALVAGTVTYRVIQRQPALPGHAEQDRYASNINARLVPVMQTGMLDHIHCAVFRKYPKVPISNEQMVSDMGPYSPLIPLIRAKVPERYWIEQAHRCTVKGRRYVHLIFRDGTALISVVMTEKHEGEWFSPGLNAASSDRFQTTAFETPGYLAWIVSDLPAQSNWDIAASVQPVVTKFLAAFKG